MKISEIKKGMIINGWEIKSEVSKERVKKQTKYFARVKCPNYGTEEVKDINPIVYRASSKCYECNKPRKYLNKYIEKQLTVEIHLIGINSGETEYISIIDKKHYEQVKQYNWGIASSGYVINTRNNRGGDETGRLHRFICLLEYGLEEIYGRYIDHISRDKLDNRLCNLNIVTPLENVQNTNLFSNNTSGVKGVSWRDKEKKWGVSIQYKKKRYYLGRYAELNEAIRVRKEAECKYHKYHNSINGGEVQKCHH